MLKAIYLGKSFETVRYFLSQEYRSIKYHNCTDLDFEGFYKLHTPSLLSSRNITVFYNFEDISKTDLVKLIDNDSLIDFIWCFNSLAKTTKVFKKASELGLLKEVPNLEDGRSKGKFIRARIKEMGLVLSEETLQTVMQLPGSPTIITNELQKYALSQSSDSIVLYTEEANIFKVIDAVVFDRGNLDQVVNQYSNENNSVLTYILLSKYLKCLLYLALGDDEGAFSIWKTPYSMLGEVKAFTKELGYRKLLEVSEYVEVVLNPVRNRTYDSSGLSRSLRLLHSYILFKRLQN